MDTFSSQSNTNAISVRAGRRSGLTFVDKEQISMPGSPRPYRVHQPRTTFLKQTMERALTPRAKDRAEALRELERLVAIKADGGSLGVRLHLAGSLARQYPVSHRAITLELFDQGLRGSSTWPSKSSWGFGPGSYRAPRRAAKHIPKTNLSANGIPTTETSDIETVAPEAKVASVEPLSGMRLLPGEDPADKEQLRLALAAELTPRTAYQKRLAEQLVDYEWEIDRHRRLRDLCLLAQYQANARTLLDRGRPIERFEGSSLKPDDELLARDLVSPLEADRRESETDLLNRTHWHPEHVLAMAAGKCPAADAHEDRIRDLERRRALLRKEYRDMTSARTTAVEDAEIIEDDG